MKSVIFEIPNIYFDDNLVTVLEKELMMTKNITNRSLYTGYLDEFNLSFDDLNSDVIGAIVKLKAQADANNVYTDASSKITSAFNGSPEILTAREFLQIVMASSDKLSFDKYEQIKILEVFYDDDNNLVDMELEILSEPCSKKIKSNNLNEAMTLFKSA